MIWQKKESYIGWDERLFCPILRQQGEAEALDALGSPPT